MDVNTSDAQFIPVRLDIFQDGRFDRVRWHASQTEKTACKFSNVSIIIET